MSFEGTILRTSPSRQIDVGMNGREREEKRRSANSCPYYLNLKRDNLLLVSQKLSLIKYLQSYLTEIFEIQDLGEAN